MRNLRTASAGQGGGGLPALRSEITVRLAEAGCVAPAEEADELLVAAAGDRSTLDVLVARRIRGEPLAWVTTRSWFGQLEVRIDPGVYVPRWQSLELGRRAVARLPDHGVAIDLCTGSGALALALRQAHPNAQIAASDVDPRAVACARSNGVEAHLGDLFEPFSGELRGHADLVTAVPPYVPTHELRLLPRDTLDFEDVTLYDGGPDGLAVLRRIIAEALDYLRARGSLLLEIGGNQDELLIPELGHLGYSKIRTWSDEDGDLRGLEAVRPDP